MMRQFFNIEKMKKRIENQTVERLVWCIVSIFLCWTQVQNYHEYIFWQKIWIISAVGAYYCVKLGFFQKRKRILCGIATILGIALTMHMVKTNFYMYYYYLNLPLGVFITIVANLYILVIYNAVKEKRIPLEIGPSIVLVFWLLMKQTSVYDYKQYYFYVLLSLLPLIMMRKEKQENSSILKGILDGMCIGFFVTQGYAWMHRPYNYSTLRYIGFAIVCTTMSRIYISYFAAWLIKYVQLSRQKKTVWSTAFRLFAWITATFILSLQYLTGSRSAVLAMIFVTAVAIAVRYLPDRSIEDWKWIGRIGLWLVNCCCIGLVSLALFPTAYATVRYIPAYVNQPDYMNYTGYRMGSRPIQVWGEYFDKDNEYDYDSVMENESIDSVKYATFEESVEHNLGRIIPGAGEYLTEVLSSDLWFSGQIRAEYYLEQGEYSQNYYRSIIKELERRYISNNSNTKKDEDSKKSLLDVYDIILQKVLSTLVLRIDAEVVDAKDGNQILSRGDSPDYPWYTKEEYPGNGMTLRLAIHEYSIGKLNREGHKQGSFNMWATSSNVQPHAHNIFLIEGYDFGIPSMIMMFLFLGITLLVAMYNVLRRGMVEYLLPVLLIVGITVFGWFESGFTYKDETFMWVTLCSVFTNMVYNDRRRICEEQGLV